MIVAPSTGGRTTRFGGLEIAKGIFVCYFLSKSKPVQTQQLIAWPEKSLQ